MTPGTLVLLHPPYACSGAWGDVPEALRADGLDVVAPDVPDSSGPRYVARASLVISATAATAPLVLVARGGAGPLLPAVALAQRAAHRAVGGYVFVDAELPRPQHAQRHDHGGQPIPVPPDWPEAPCGYLRTLDAGDAGDDTGQAVREARLRGWPTAERVPAPDLARSLADLISAL
ncbi:hypothetical protein GCM10023085_09600 [Actinomadura viridis]|uniref:Alpha/beta hydrolase n=1 Tax=Actinomadura viridis TaxID=58110 RepID=A0A931DM00_9ACTN|nr:hypothetical protein [Actinomadura viridis]MBG6091972.1 hypothetical protein [Actinomadura viridis]